jgi:hypothetical protein
MLAGFTALDSSVTFVDPYDNTSRKHAGKRARAFTHTAT